MALDKDFKIKNGLTVVSSITAGGNLSASEGYFIDNLGVGTNPTGDTKFSVDGDSGNLFSVTDAVTGIVFSVNDAAGLPILEVESTATNDTITIGEYSTNAIVVSGACVGLGGATNSYTLDVTGDINASTNILSGGVDLANIFATSAGNVDGSGTACTLAVWEDADTVGDSILYADTSTVCVGGALSAHRFCSNDSSNNIKIGNGALVSLTSGADNIGMGCSVLQYNTTGSCNIAMAKYALTCNTGGSGNFAAGYAAMFNNTDGSNNAAIGNSALRCNTTGTSNAAIGVNALTNNTTGSHNTALGCSALLNSLSGDHNFAAGISALYNNWGGCHNTAIGNSTLNKNTTGNNNTAIGNTALYLNTTGNNNTAIGGFALYSNTTGCFNNAIGFDALFANTTGCYNIAFGERSLCSNTEGNHNTAFGSCALRNNTTGGCNTAITQGALLSNTTGCNNTALGSYALVCNTTGNYNTAIGCQNSFYNTSGSHNFAVGHNALHCNTTGSNNIALGQCPMFGSLSGTDNFAAGTAALYCNWGGYCNIAIGCLTLRNNSTGSNNIGLGYAALNANTTGTHNIALGQQALVSNTASNNFAAGCRALCSNTTGTNNAAIGPAALCSNTTGVLNYAIGCNALTTNTEGNYSVAIGFNTLKCNTIGNNNVGLGVEALYGNQTGFSNVGVGRQALYCNSGGIRNVGIGEFTGWSNTSGSQNVVLGFCALYSSTNSSSNTVLGALAGRCTASGNVTGATGSIAIGFDARFGDATPTNEIVIGCCAQGNGDNTTTIGNSSTTAAYICGDISTSSLSASNNVCAENIYVGSNIYHTGDDNTCIAFTDDVITLCVGGENVAQFGTGGTVFNNDSLPNDFIVRGDSQASLFYVDASADRIGIGTSGPGHKVDVRSAGAEDGIAVTASDGCLRFKARTSGSSTGGGYLSLFDSSTNDDVRISAEGDSYFNGGNVGIGITSPDNPLEVFGSDSGIKISSISTDRPQLTLDSGGTEKLIVSSNSTYGALGDSTDIDRYMVFNAGNIGVGVSAPGEKFTVAGNLSASGTGFVDKLGIGAEPSGDEVLTVDGTNGNLFTITDSVTGTVFAVSDSAGLPILEAYTDACDMITMGEYGSNALVVCDTKVGVGTATPSEPLDVVGTARMDSGITESTHYVGHSVQHWGDGGTGLYFSANDVIDLQTASTSRIHIDSSGNVGIGTLDPTTKLTLSGSVADGTALFSLYNYCNAAGAGIQFNDNSTGIQSGYITYRHVDGCAQGGATSFHFTSTENDTVTIFGNSACCARLVVKSATSIARPAYSFYDDIDTGMTRTGADTLALATGGSNRLTILSNGNVGIGCTAPVQKLDVADSINTSGAYMMDGATIINCGREFIGYGVDMGDNRCILLGDSDDLRIFHNSSHSYIHSDTGNLNIENDATDGDIIFKSDDGIGGLAQYFRLDGGNVLTYFSKPLQIADCQSIFVGGGGDLKLCHNGTNSYVTNNTGNLNITNNTDDGWISFYNDDGAGNTTEYFRVDGGTERVESSKSFRFAYGARAQFGASSDTQLYHDATDAYLTNGTGHLYIRNEADDCDIIFQSDDGAGGVTNYFKIDGGAGTVNFDKNSFYPDSVCSLYGNGYDLRLQHNGTDSVIQNQTGDLYISNFAADKDLVFRADDGAGGFETYFFLDGSAGVVNFPDSKKLTFGASQDLQIYHDGSHSLIKDTGTGNIRIDANDFYVRNAAGTQVKIGAIDSAAVDLYYNGLKKFETTSSGVSVTGDALVTGHLCAATKSFLIDNPETGGKLRYSVVEGNEHGVTVRGSTCCGTIDLPAEWAWLVDEDSVTAQLTPVGSAHTPYVICQNNKEVVVCAEGCYNYNIYGTRKDVEPLEVNQ